MYVLCQCSHSTAQVAVDAQNKTPNLPGVSSQKNSHTEIHKKSHSTRNEIVQRNNDELKR